MNTQKAAQIEAIWALLSNICY